MKPMFKTILLVDDDEATNFIHQRVIGQMNFAKNIVVRESGIDALRFLTTLTNGQYPKPDIIFLDINMPVMNGWEFLEAYGSLQDNQKAETILLMLSTSLSPEDKIKAAAFPSISGFIDKPLTEDKLQYIHNNFNA